MKKLILIIFVLLPLFTHAQGYICAVGGGPEEYNDWSDAPYKWIVEKSSKGKIVILSVNDETEWIPDYFKSFGAASAVNIRIASRTTANLQSTYDTIISANAIFIKGGDQWKYIANWKGTKTEEAIKYVFNNGGTVAGTSAGAMSLSGVVFTAKNNSAYPKESLINPFYDAVNLDDDFLNLVPNVIIDTHVAERGRVGRLIPFMFNYFINSGNEILGIGIDDMTALCIDKSGIATVHGSGAVSFFQKDELTKFENSAQGYLVENLKCDQLVDGWSYDLNKRIIYSRPESAKQINAVSKAELPVTDIWLSGSNDVHTNIDQGLSEFLMKYKPANACIISVMGETNSLKEISYLLDTKGISNSQIIISNESLINPSEVDKIENADVLIFYGNDLNTLSRLGDTTKPAGQVLRNKATQGVPIYAFGNPGKVLCGSYIDNVDSRADASYRGTMTNNTGINLFGDLIFQPMIFSNDDYYENRFSALFYGMMRNRKMFGLILDADNYAAISAENKSIKAFGQMPLFIVDATETNWVDSSRYHAGGSGSTRQLVAMDNLRFTVTNVSKQYSFQEKGVITSLKDNFNNQENINYYLDDNYPNPFNGSTIIRFSLSRSTHTNLVVYNILGQEVQKLADCNLGSGTYRYFFNPQSSVVSGIYIYKLTTQGFTQAKKMVYLR